MAASKKPSKANGLSPRDEAAVIKFILVSVYTDLRIKSHSCDYCDDVYSIWVQLKKTLDEYGIKINQITDITS